MQFNRHILILIGESQRRAEVNSWFRVGPRIILLFQEFGFEFQFLQVLPGSKRSGKKAAGLIPRTFHRERGFRTLRSRPGRRCLCNYSDCQQRETIAPRHRPKSQTETSRVFSSNLVPAAMFCHHSSEQAIVCDVGTKCKQTQISLESELPIDFH